SSALGGLDAAWEGRAYHLRLAAIRSGDCARNARRRSDIDPTRRSTRGLRNFGVWESLQMKLYVGNLSYSTSQAELQDLFGQYGQVTDVALIMDRDTGRPKGFGFVEMDDDGA